MDEDLSPEEVDALSEAMGDEGETSSEEAAPVSAPAPEEETGAATISRAQFLQLEEIAKAADLPPGEMDKMYDLKVRVEVVLGRTKMPLEEVLKLQTGSIVELDKLAGEPVEISANGKLIARAEIVVVEENFGVKILEIEGTRQKLSAIQG